MNSQSASPMTIPTLIAESEGWDAEVSEITLNADQLHFNVDGIPQHNGELIRMDQSSRTRLFDKLGAPAGYLEKHSPQFQVTALTEDIARREHCFGSKPTLVVRNGELVTIARGDLFALPNADVLRAVGQSLGNDAETLVVARIERDAEELDIELISPAKEIAVRPGDIVRSGLHIGHERFGTQATLIEAFIYRLVCSNGMTRRECVRDGIKRTRKLPVDFPNNRELQMDQIRQLTRQNWNGLQGQLEALRASSERPAHVEELLIRWLQRGRLFSESILQRLLSVWRSEGSENTQYGAVNALTAVATHDRSLSERHRQALASLAGLLAFSEVHICERCFSVLAAR
jgi:hypothetical protein